MEIEPFSLTPQSISYLSTAKKWAMFLAIVGFIMVALFIVMGLFFAFAFNFTDISPEYAPMGTAFSVASAVIYFIIAIIYFIPVWYLFQFSRKLGRALKREDAERLAESFRNLKNCFVSYGILTILAILFYCLFFALGLFTALGTMGAQ